LGKRFSVDNDDIPEVEKPVKLISITPDSENLIAYCARVSSNQQDNPSISKLLRYCIKGMQKFLILLLIKLEGKIRRTDKTQ